MRNVIIAMCAVFLLMSCGGMNYSQRYDPAVNFEQFKTYVILPLPDKKGKDTLLLLKNMSFAVDKALQAKGYRQETNNPDFLVALHAVTERRVDVQQYGYAYSSGFYDHPAYLNRHGEHGHYYPRTSVGPETYEYRRGVDVYEYRVANLLVDIVRAEGKELVWRGTAEGVLQDNITQQYIRDIVTNILKGFPPPAVQ